VRYLIFFIDFPFLRSLWTIGFNGIAGG